MTTRSKAVETPLVIEAAITPLRVGQPLQTTQQMISESLACLEAGATVIHHHHDFRLPREEAIAQIVAVGKAMLAEFPHALFYSDYIRGSEDDEKIGRRYAPDAIIRPLHAAGVLRMFALDPGLTLFPRLDERGIPSTSVTGGTRYAEAHDIVEFGCRLRAPISLGVYEPGHLRWLRAYALAGKLPSGSMIKLYFGGEYVMGQRKVPGVAFGLHPTTDALDMYLSMMDGIDTPWIVSVQGGVILDKPLARYALERGGHIRVGVEDTAGGTEMTNRQTVEAAVALAKQIGRPVARGEEALRTLSRHSAAIAA
jgi:3-keto-5-aminohexanoate cleavage enzyme